VNLITYVDDYGRGDARPAIIKGTCFPLRERLTNKEIEAGLTGLAGLGCIGLYRVDGRSYLYFPTWEKHQSIRNKKSKFPAPEEASHGIESNCNQVKSNVPVIQSESESESKSEYESEEPPKPPKGVKQRQFIPPTLEDVEAFCRERNSPVNPKDFWEYYNATNWIDSNGKPVKSWKGKLLTWEKYQNTKTGRGSGTPDYTVDPEDEEVLHV
jgi:hypothetical protein